MKTFAQLSMTIRLYPRENKLGWQWYGRGREREEINPTPCCLVDALTPRGAIQTLSSRQVFLQFSPTNPIPLLGAHLVPHTNDTSQDGFGCR